MSYIHKITLHDAGVLWVVARMMQDSLLLCSCPASSLCDILVLLGLFFQLCRYHIQTSFEQACSRPFFLAFPHVIITWFGCTIQTPLKSQYNQDVAWLITSKTPFKESRLTRTGLKPAGHRSCQFQNQPLQSAANAWSKNTLMQVTERISPD